MLSKSKEKILIIIGTLAVFTFYLLMFLAKETTNLDELWNYNIARNIALGLIPYKDISLITTPLLPIIEGLILRITVNELITFRIINAVLITLIILSTYKLYRALGIHEIISIILTIPLILLLKDEAFLDYNFFILFISLIITIIEVKHIENELPIKQEVLIGILAGIAVCTKHTIGGLICACVLLTPITKNLSKTQLKIIGLRLLGEIIPITLTLIYLIITGGLADFLSYTFLAINTFTNSIPYTQLLKTNDYVIKILAILLPALTIGTIVWLLGNIKDEKSKAIHNKIKTMIVSALPLLMVQYPIADRVHFVISNYIVIIIMLFLIYVIAENLILKLNPKTVKIVQISTTFFVIMCSAYFGTKSLITNSITYIKSEKNLDMKYFKYLIVPNHIRDYYNDLSYKESEFEKQGKKVNILDSNAVAIHIPMDKYIKNYDMFNKGNFGKDGEEGIISQIKSSEKQVYLIKKDNYPKNWQTPTMIIDYIKNNLKKIDEIDIYDIYE